MLHRSLFLINRLNQTKSVVFVCLLDFQRTSLEELEIPTASIVPYDGL